MLRFLAFLFTLGLYIFIAEQQFAEKTFAFKMSGIFFLIVACCVYYFYFKMVLPIFKTEFPTLHITILVISCIVFYALSVEVFGCNFSFVLNGTISGIFIIGVLFSLLIMLARWQVSKKDEDNEHS